MIVSDGYTAEYYRKRNEIIITLPQTMETLTSTAAMIVNRKDITDAELIAIISVVRAIVEVKT